MMTFIPIGPLQVVVRFLVSYAHVTLTSFLYDFFHMSFNYLCMHSVTLGRFSDLWKCLACSFKMNVFLVLLTILNTALWI